MLGVTHEFVERALSLPTCLILKKRPSIELALVQLKELHNFRASTQIKAVFHTLKKKNTFPFIHL